ncbi:peptide deformylase [Synechococcales cyanobacterium C]|uniref:Peptide deformylase n=1 Tax=Petrachloros mirabilis ULC683 TaxID=2781853 RepID=A0A8K1ZYZ4_9CYAN|nr:peptide deformylase [Petrachloros mirabilis]NCJ07398.1 peptide deformylase [Petrachloros mirabilis ULC683]
MTSPLPIVQLGNPLLRQSAATVTDIQAPATQAFIEQMLTTLYEAEGVGISAPQLGLSAQILIVASHPNPRYPQAPTMNPVVMINPQILAYAEERMPDWEGCLSVPGLRGLVPRHRSVQMQYCDRNGTPQKLELTDFPARIFQHEYDHLHGYVFLDRVNTTLDLSTEQEYQRLIETATSA